MNIKHLRLFGIFFLIGSIANDVFVFERDGFLTWAKLMFAFGVIFCLASGLSARKPARIEIAVYAHVILLAFLCFLPGGYGFSARSLSVISSLLMGAISLSVFVRVNVDVLTICRIYIYWMTFGVVIGFVQALSGALFFTDRIFESTVIPGLYRASGLMSDPNYFSLICLLALPLAVFSRHPNLVRIFIFLGAFLSGSRAGILVVVASAVVGFVFWRGKSGRLTRACAVLALLLIGVVLLRQYIPAEILLVFDASAYGEGAERNSLQDRAFAISAALNAFIDNPLTGYGVGNVVNHPLNIRRQVSHNTYIEILAETGLIGIFSYLFVCYVAVKGRRVSRSFASGAIYTTRSFVFFGIFSLMSMTLVTYYSRILFFALALSVLLRGFQVGGTRVHHPS